MEPYDPRNPKMLATYFDVQNKGHLQAYRHLQNAGQWPAWFMDEMDVHGVIIHQNWQVALAFKMADAWLDEKLRDEDQ